MEGGQTLRARGCPRRSAVCLGWANLSRLYARKQILCVHPRVCDAPVLHTHLTYKVGQVGQVCPREACRASPRTTPSHSPARRLDRFARKSGPAALTPGTRREVAQLMDDLSGRGRQHGGQAQTGAQPPCGPSARHMAVITRDPVTARGNRRVCTREAALALRVEGGGSKTSNK